MRLQSGYMIASTKRGNLTLMTNFSYQYKSQYELTLEYYNKIIDAKNRYEFIIDSSSESNSYDGGLWYSNTPESGRDASLFWDIFKLVELKKFGLLNHLSTKS